MGDLGVLVENVEDPRLVVIFDSPLVVRDHSEIAVEGVSFLHGRAL